MPSTACLLYCALTLSGPGLLGSSPMDMDESSIARLQLEYAELESQRIDLSVPIVVLSVSLSLGGIAAGGVVFGTFLTLPGLVIASVAVLAASVAGAVVGGVLLGQAIGARVRRMRRMNELERRFEEEGQPEEFARGAILLALTYD